MGLCLNGPIIKHLQYMSIFGPWSVMVGHGRSWSVMVGHGRSWSVMVGCKWGVWLSIYKNIDSLWTTPDRLVVVVKVAKTALTWLVQVVAYWAGNCESWVQFPRDDLFTVLLIIVVVHAGHIQSNKYTRYALCNSTAVVTRFSEPCGRGSKPTSCCCCKASFYFF